MMRVRFIVWFCAAAVFLAAGAVRAELPQNYPEMFNELSALIDGGVLGPMEMVRGGWLATRCFAPSDEGLEFNREQFIDAESPGQTTVSGLFLAMHGDSRTRLLVRSELETNLSKRKWLWLTVGTEEAFFKQFNNGVKLQSLTRALPATDGLRTQCWLLMQSSDPLTRRAGLLWGCWLADDGYRWAVNHMATEDVNPVNRACAIRLLKMF
jgi:hypothetical protein